MSGNEPDSVAAGDFVVPCLGEECNTWERAVAFRRSANPDNRGCILAARAVEGWNPAVGATGSPDSNLRQVTNQAASKVPRSHCRCLAPARRGEGAWRNTAKWFSGGGYAALANARRCSLSVPTVTAASAIAAPPAVDVPAFNNTVAPIADTGTVRKRGRIIANVSEGTANNIAHNVAHNVACRIILPLRSLFLHHLHVRRSLALDAKIHLAGRSCCAAGSVAAPDVGLTLSPAPEPG